MSVLLCLAILACSAPVVDDDDDATAGGFLEDATEPLDSGGGGEDTGYECNPWYPCQDCGGSACSSTVSACASDSTCQPALSAWAGCVLGCGRPSDCAETFARSGDRAAALLQCVTASCAEECDL